MAKIKLAICDDIEYLCQYFKSVFEKQENIDFIGMAHNSNDCLKMISSNNIDVLLLDVQIETDHSGIDLIPKIKEISPNTKIIVLTIHEEDEYVFQALLLGANDFILKTIEIEKIISAINDVYENKSSLRPEIAKKVLGECERYKNMQSSIIHTLNLMVKLSSAEFEVLEALYNGYTYREIANSRYVTESTIRSQIARLLKKFDAKNLNVLIANLKAMKIFELFDKGDKK